MLWNTIKLECKKAICNKYFVIVILIGIALTMVDVKPLLEIFYRDMKDLKRFSEEICPYNPLMPMNSLFNHWFGSQVRFPGAVDFFFLFPLLAAIPYGWSYCAERKSGYIKNMVIRTGRTKYYLSKYIAMFLSGGLAMVIPLLFNFLLMAMFIPAVLPDPVYMTGYGINSASILSMSLYTQPFLYIFFYLLIDFVFCGMIACLCFAVSLVVRNRIIAVFIPFFILLGWHYFCTTFIYTSVDVIYTEVSPMSFLIPCATDYSTSELAVLVAAIILFMPAFLSILLKGRRIEIY